MIKILTATLLTAALTTMPVEMSARTAEKQDTATVVKTKKKKSFLYHLAAPLRWVGRNWSAYDPNYSTPSFYNWVGQLQNNFSMEWLNMKYNDGMQVNMRSRLSSKLGPYLGWSFLGYGYSIDLTALKGSKKGTETGLSINSNLMNIDLIYRRTGGDFNIRKMTTNVVDVSSQGMVQKDVTELANDYNVGDHINNYVIGANFNIFLCHRKYSNPAAFSNGAVQLRSYGSPIVGFGYIHQTIDNSVGQLIENNVIQNIFQQAYNYDNGATVQKMIGYFNQSMIAKGWLDADNAITDANGLVDFMHNLRENGETEKYKGIIGAILSQPQLQAMLFGQKDGTVLKNTGMLNQLINQVPTKMTINDWHLQLGYAYNIAFSRRLLLGISAIASPGVKQVKMNNDGNITNVAAEEFANAINSYYGTDKATVDAFRQNVSRTSFGTNFSARASLTFNFNRWRAGANANANAFLYHSNDANISSIYGNCNVYVGYCFGRKKQYRWNGKDRQAYIMAALTKKDIEAMKDTMPEPNIANGVAVAASLHEDTKYKSDDIDLSVNGCDLVKGPDGTFGSYTIEDGYVTPGQDSEGRLKPGTVLLIDKNGSFKISCGHEKNFRAANWWKSQLTLRQTPNNWYPEMLHYALRGKLSLWVRSYRFGTVEPVQLVIDDFCINHGKETKKFIQIASKKFYSHSAYSIVGHVAVNGRKVRVYIESKKDGKKNYINVWPMKNSTQSWMANIHDDRCISKISIPATHDAGTASLPEGKFTSMGHTQNFTIAEQLEDGIRAFDIRLKKNMKFGHTMECRDGYPETLDSIRLFLAKHPSEFVIAMIGSDEGGKWPEEMKENYRQLISKYADLMVDSFSPRTKLGDVRGKILVIKRQEECPNGKLLKFEDNAIFEYNGFCVEDVYKEHKTYKKIKLVEQHLRDAHECLDPDKWYITFNSIAWDPRHHKPYYSAWGAVNVRKPMNPSLRSVIEDKSYTNFGMVFLDFYNDHCDHPQLVESIIKSNFNTEVEKDYIPAK